MQTLVNLAAHIQQFERIRDEWIDILVRNPDSNQAPEHIMKCNAKLELLRILNFGNEEEENGTQVP